MKKNKIIKYTSILIICCLIFFIIQMIISKFVFKKGNEYQKIKLGLDYSDIDYYTVYEDDIYAKYKVYKLSRYSLNNKIKENVEKSEFWSKNKFYEYIMNRFYEYFDSKEIKLDRENLYYYDQNGDYAVLDLKNAKLYYLNSYLYTSRTEHNKILGIEVKNNIEKEIYDVRGGRQNDGRDYYVYKFSEEQGNKILNELQTNSKWTREKISEDKLWAFEYTKEILNIDNGYYYYSLVCRTSNEYKKENFTEDEATGFEIGIYDIDNNIFYYCWEST